MADIDHDPRVAELLHNAGREATPFIHPEGVSAVRTTVRRRRRNRAIAAGAVVGLVLIGGPVAAVNLRGSHEPVNPPAATVSATPSTAVASSSPTVAPSKEQPDGKIKSSTLRNTTLSIPAWPAKGFDVDCPHGKVHFKDGESGLLALEGSPVYQDVDADGALETVSLVSCNPQGSDYKVLAFDRDAAGKIVTLGQVVASAGTAGHPGDDPHHLGGRGRRERPGAGRCGRVPSLLRRGSGFPTPDPHVRVERHRLHPDRRPDLVRPEPEGDRPQCHR